QQCARAGQFGQLFHSRERFVGPRPGPVSQSVTPGVGRRGDLYPLGCNHSIRLRRSRERSEDTSLESSWLQNSRFPCGTRTGERGRKMTMHASSMRSLLAMGLLTALLQSVAARAETTPAKGGVDTRVRVAAYNSAEVYKLR